MQKPNRPNNIKAKQNCPIMFNEETSTLCCLAILHNTNETFPLVLSILPTMLAGHQSTFSIACKQVPEVPSH